MNQLIGSEFHSVVSGLGFLDMFRFNFSQYYTAYRRRSTDMKYVLVLEQTRVTTFYNTIFQAHRD